MKTTDFARQLTRFLTEYLPSQRNVSPHTIKAYRDVFVLLLRFCRDNKRWSTENVWLKNLDASVIVDFLEYLERERKCCTATRNHRLAALHSFFRYVQTEVPECLMQCQRILAIPARRKENLAPHYLSSSQIRKLLSLPNQATRSGRRDVTLLSLLYDCGARVQELINLQSGDVRLELPAHARLTGKGRKTRIVPIMSATVELLRMYMEEQDLLDPHRTGKPLFTNRRGERISRFGVRYILNKYTRQIHDPCTGPMAPITPHTLRHSKAMHLLEADTPLVIIRDFLGHVDINTTEIYARASLKMKRQALEKVENSTPQASMPAAWKTNEKLLEWLRAL
jgi:site-specific recombinase XerD